MEDKDITRPKTSGSIEEYRRLHELAKNGVGSSSSFDVDIDDDDDETNDEEHGPIPLDAYADKGGNEWWVEMISGLAENSDDFKYDKNADKVGFWVRLKRGGKNIGKKRYLWCDDMMDAMRIVGTISFSLKFYTSDYNQWEFEIAEAAMRTFGMFLDSLDDADLEINLAIRAMMSFRSGYFRGAALRTSDMYEIYKLLDKVIDFNEPEFDDITKEE